MKYALSSSRLLAQKTRAAAALLKPQLHASTKAIVALSRSPALIAVMYGAANALGLPLLPLDPQLSAPVRKRLLQTLGEHGLVADKRMDDGRCILTEAVLNCALDAAIPPSAHAPEAIALLMASSGSSGDPKLIMLTSSALDAAASASAARTPLHENDRWLACLPLFHIGGFSILVRCAQAGAEALLLERFDAQAVWRTLHEQAITHLSLVPTMLAQLLEHKASPPPPALHHLLVSGAALPADLARRAAALGWPLQPSYGLTEMASQAASFAAFPADWSAGQVGKPLPGVEAALTADGRLKLRGPMQMAGYLNAQWRRGDGLHEGWLVTEDRAQIDADGGLRIIGRADSVIVSGGKKIHPAQVETQLLHCPGVREALVVGCTDAVWGEIVALAYVGSINEAAVLDWCRSRMRSAERPRRIWRMERFPELANGKPDRRAVQTLIRTRCT